MINYRLMNISRNSKLILFTEKVGISDVTFFLIALNSPLSNKPT